MHSLTEQEYRNAKCILEYFVAHLIWVQNQDKSGIGYEKYLQPWIDNNTFKSEGAGYNGDKIQNQIAQWQMFNHRKLCITIKGHYGQNYTTKRCYLNWEDTGINIVAHWDEKKTFIHSLSAEDFNYNRRKINQEISLEKLGLFDDYPPNEILITFFDIFYQELIKQDAEYLKGNEMDKINTYIELLKQHKNLILTGAPGTGKTYLAQKIAENMGAYVEFVQFHPSYDYSDFIEGLRPVKKENAELGFELKEGIFKSFCRMAQKNIDDSQKTTEQLKNEGYLKILLNDFVDYIENQLNKLGEIELFGIKGENILPIVDLRSQQDNLTFYVKRTNRKLSVKMNNFIDIYIKFKEKGKENWNTNNIKTIVSAKYHTTYQLAFLILFDRFISEGKNNDINNLQIQSDIEKKNFVFIIDEINRAEISKVFGELFYSIDPGYRGVRGKVKTQYANLQDEDDLFYSGFYIPENVYIIGTMNDIDRSVEFFDFAMRRRFVWHEVTAEQQAYILDQLANYAEIAKQKMTALNRAIDEIQLGSAYHIGPTYFLKIQNYTENVFEKLWKYHLEPLLREYLRGTIDITQQLEYLKNAYANDE